MAITYPLTDLIGFGIVTQQFKPQFRQQISRQPSGAVTGIDFGQPVWVASYVTATMSQDDCVDFEADLNSLEGVKGTFLGRDTRRLAPREHPNGGFADVATVGAINANRKALTLTGLTVGMILSKGDYVQIEVGGVKFLYQSRETVVVGAGGVTPEFEVHPTLHVSAAAGNAARLMNPACLMRLEPNSVQYNPGSSALGTVSFNAMQVYS